MVAMLQVVGEILCLQRKKALVLAVESLPMWNLLGARRKHRPRGHDAQLELPPQSLFTVAVPSHVEATRVAAPPRERRLVRPVRSRGSEVDEEGPLRCNGLL